MTGIRVKIEPADCESSGLEMFLKISRFSSYEFFDGSDVGVGLDPFKAGALEDLAARFGFCDFLSSFLEDLLVRFPNPYLLIFSMAINNYRGFPVKSLRLWTLSLFKKLLKSSPSFYLSSFSCFICLIKLWYRKPRMEWKKTKVCWNYSLRTSFESRMWY